MPEIEPDVISMGVDISKFGKQHFVPDYFGQGNKKVVLFVGRLAEIKGVTYLLEAMKSIDALLVIVGDGPLRADLEAQAIAIKDKVVFLGAKTHEELKTLYASADIFVAPSVTAKDGGQEGLGLVILEALASGLPVVASRSGGIVQLIKDGINGFLCDEKNVEQMISCINSMIDDEKIYYQFAENSNKSIRNYDYSITGEKYIEILK